MKKIIPFISFLILCMLLVGCNLSGTGKMKEDSIFDQWNKVKSLDLDASTTINYLIPTSWSNSNTLHTIIEKFEKETGYTVDVQSVMDEQYDNIVKAKLKNGKGLDIFFGSYQQHDVVNTMVEIDPEEFQGRLKEGMIDSLYYKNGKVYGYPKMETVNTYGIYYNKSIFKKYGLDVPTTLEELDNLSQILKENGIIPFYFAAKDGWTLLQHRNVVNGTLIKESKSIWNQLGSGSKKWDVPSFREQYLALGYWIEQGYINDNFSLATYQVQVNALAKGECAMVFQGNWVIREVMKVDKDADIGFFPLPTSDGGNPIAVGCFSGGAHIAINSNVQEASKDFLRFLIQPEQVQLYLQENMGLSPYNDVNADSSLSKAFQEIQYYMKNNPISPHGDDVFSIPVPQDDIIKLYQELLTKKIDVNTFIINYQKAIDANTKLVKIPNK